MKRLVLLGAGIYLLGMMIACSDDNSRDDSVLDISLLIGKYWYYNAWQGDKYGMVGKDVLEVMRLEKGGALKMMEFGGRRETVVGQWSCEDNRLLFDYRSGEQLNWSVLHSGDDYIEMINDLGTRKYTTEADYLQDLTADAFLVNDYSDGNVFRTRFGAIVRGNINVRDAALIVSDKNYISLENHGYYWNERSPEQSDYIRFDAKGREVRFYLRIGRNTDLKLRDSIYPDNLPERAPATMALLAYPKDGNLNVCWNPYERKDVYYRVEVFPADMDLDKPYFVSRIQNSGSEKLSVSTTTAVEEGTVNKLRDLQKGKTYQVRLSAVLYEPGIDRVNDGYSYANLQAITYFTKEFIWN